MKKSVLLVMLLAFAMMFAVACGTKKTSEEPKEEDTKYITNIDDVTWIQCSNGEKTVTIEYADEAWFLEDNREDWITQSGVESMVEATNKLIPISEVENPKALSEYGLETPAYTVILKNDLDKEVKLYLGNVIPVAEGEEPEECYATTGDKEKVYIISKTVMDALLYDVETMIVEETDPMEALKNMVNEEEVTEDDALGNVVDEVVEETTTTDDTPEVDDTVDSTEQTPETPAQ